MNGASTAIGVAGSVYPPVKHNGPRLSGEANRTRQKPPDSEKSGALALAENVLSQSLGSAGFVDLTAPFNESFVRGLHYHPVETGTEDLKPGVLEELMSWMTSKTAVDASQALAAQARVSPEAAVRLLT